MIWPLLWSGGSAECYLTCQFCNYSENINPRHSASCYDYAKDAASRRRCLAEDIKDATERARMLTQCDEMDQRIKEYQDNER